MVVALMVALAPSSASLCDWLCDVPGAPGSHAGHARHDAVTDDHAAHAGMAHGTPAAHEDHRHHGGDGMAASRPVAHHGISASSQQGPGGSSGVLRSTCCANLPGDLVTALVPARSDVQPTTVAVVHQVRSVDADGRRLLPSASPGIPLPPHGSIAPLVLRI
jgi:hypothetical protein